GYARRVFVEAEVRHSLALDRISRLAEANALLSSLHRVAQSLPSSFDLDEILVSTISRIREMVDFTAAAVLLGDGADGTWTVGIAEGMRLSPEVADADLPPALRTAAADAGPRAFPQLGGVHGPGLGPMAGSGVY